MKGETDAPRWTSHTPGPWGVFGASLEMPEIRSVNDGQAGRLIGFVSAEPEEQSANARLIAAAPDLYAACEAAIEQEDCYAEGTDSLALNGCLHCVLLAALDKADGNS